MEKMASKIEERWNEITDTRTLWAVTVTNAKKAAYSCVKWKVNFLKGYWWLV